MFLLNSAYYENSEIDIPNYEIPCLITSAGQTRIETRSQFNTKRPEGRRDYQLIYIKTGQLYCNVNGEEFVAPNNSFLIYHPEIPQYYTMYLKDATDIYWIHFTGKEIDVKLKTLNLFDEMLYHVTPDKSYEKIMFEIISELKSKSAYYDDICVSSLTKLLLLIARNRINVNIRDNNIDVIIDEIIALLKENYKEHFNIGELAKHYNISHSYLVRSFNKKAGMSPQKYLNHIRMEKAKLLLKNTDNITGVAASVGYGDPLYFSRLFRKLNGISPTEYYKTNKKVKVSDLGEVPWYRNGFDD